MTTKTFDPSSIPADRKATFNQIKRVSFRFASKGFKAVERTNDYRLATVIRALILKYHNEVAKDELTHGEIQKLLEAKVLPKRYRDLYDASYSAPESSKAVPQKAVKTAPEPSKEDVVNTLKDVLSTLSLEEKMELLGIEVEEPEVELDDELEAALVS
jgi:hypothetical protein